MLKTHLLSIPLILLAFLGGRTFAAPFTEQDEKLLLSKATPEQACHYQVLKDLGWMPEKKPTDTKDDGGNPCEVYTLKQAYDRKHLRLVFPADLSKVDLKTVLAGFEEKTKNDVSLCAFKLKVSDAVGTAQNKILQNINNDRYKWINQSEHYLYCVPDDSWQPLKFGYLKCSIARVIPSQAVECFYEKECQSDCAVGRQAFELAILYELYGKSDFDLAFTPDEMAIGEWDALRQSNSAFYKGYVRESKPRTIQKMELGAPMLVGVQGGVVRTKSDLYVDTLAAHSENIVITFASQASVKSLIHHLEALGTDQPHGAFDGTNKLNEELFRACTTLTPEKRKELYEHYRDGKELTGYDARILEILKDPVYKDILVYNFAFETAGVMSLGAHLLRQCHLNPRNNYIFYMDSVSMNTSVFARYTKYQYEKCLKSQAGK